MLRTGYPPAVPCLCTGIPPETLHRRPKRRYRARGGPRAQRPLRRPRARRARAPEREERHYAFSNGPLTMARRRTACAADNDAHTVTPMIARARCFAAVGFAARR